MDPQRGVPRPSITPGYGIFVSTPGMLRAYASPPPESMKDMPPPVRFESIDLPEKAYVGLVLDVKHTYLFVSVLVRHPDERKAGWINIWTSRNRFGLKSGCRYATWSPPGGFVDEAPVTFQRGCSGPPGRTAGAAAAADDEQPAKVPRTRENEGSLAEGNPCKEKREIRLCDRIEI